MAAATAAAAAELVLILMLIKDFVVVVIGSADGRTIRIGLLLLLLLPDFDTQWIFPQTLLISPPPLVLFSASEATPVS